MDRGCLRLAPSARLPPARELAGACFTRKVRGFYKDIFIGTLPDDWDGELKNRVVGESALVDEIRQTFTDVVEKCGFLISAAVFRLSCAGGCCSNPRCIDFDAN